MLTQDQLAAYFEGQLPADERIELERLLAEEPEAQRALADQQNLHLALGVLLGPAQAHERVKQSIFMVLRGATTEQLTAQVMAETREVPTARPAPLGPRLWDRLQSWINRDAAPEPTASGSAVKPVARVYPWSRPALGFVSAVVVLVSGLWIYRLSIPATLAPIGEFAAVVGQPTIQHSRTRSATAVQRSTPVHLGDRITTGDADRAEIRFRDGTTLRLGFNTVVELPAPDAQCPTSNVQRRTPNPELTTLNSQPSTLNSLATTDLLRPAEVLLLRGQIWTKVQTLTNQPEYAIRTDLATAVARGTEFGVRLQRRGQVVQIPNPQSAMGIQKSEGRSQKAEIADPQRPTSNVQRSTFNPDPSTLLAVLTVKEGTVDFFNSFGMVQATAMTESTARADSAPTEPKRLETLQIVRLDDASTWSLMTAALDWPEAAARLVGGGGSVGWQLREVPGAEGRSEVLISQLPSGSPAAQAGLRLGDAILAVNGQAVTHARQVASAILLQPNGAVSLQVRREAVETTVAVAVTEAANALRGPSLPADSHAQLTDLLRQWLGSPLTASPEATAERRRFEQVASLTRPSAFARKATADESGTLSHRMGEGRGEGNVRAAAFNQLGVVFELEDALGPAVRAYGRAVYLEPDIPLYRFNLALALRQIGSFERAFEELAAAVELEPESALVRKRFAEIHSLLGRNDDALALTDSALQSHPQDHGLWELKAQLLIKTGRPAEAVDAARRAAALDPECPIAHAYLAEALHETGRLAEAESAYLEAIERAPLEAALHMNSGSLLRDQGRLDLAEQSLDRAVELQPDSALAWFNLGDLLTERGDLTAAEAALDRAAGLDPDDAHTRRGQGMLALKQRQYDTAEAAFHAARTLAPHDPEVFYGLGELERLRGRFAEAERAYRKAIELHPDYAAAHTSMGIVFYERGDADEAERFYRRAIELNPARPAPYHNLGTLYREVRGDLDAAEHWYRQALQLASDDPDSLGGLGLVTVERGDLDEAERLLRRAWELNPESSTLNNNLGELLRRRGRLDEAEPFYRKTLELDPDNRAAYGNLGILYAMRQQFAEAESMFRDLLQRTPGEPAMMRVPALVNLASVCAEQGKVTEAEQFFREALGLNPDHPLVCGGLALFLADHQLKLDEALELATRAVAGAPNDPQSLDTLGWVHAQRGEFDAAEEILKRALSLAGEDPPAAEIRDHLDRVSQMRKTFVP